MAKKPYTVKEPLRHDGKDYAIDDSIDLDIGEDHHLLRGLAVAVLVVPSMKKPSKAEAEAKAKAEAEAKAKAEAEAKALADAAGAEAAAAVVENTTGQGE